MKLRILTSACTLAFLAFHTSVFAQTLSYQITASGKDLGQLQKVKNCIEYRVCNTAQSRIGGSADSWRLHSIVELSLDEFDSVSKECGVDTNGTTVYAVSYATQKSLDIVFQNLNKDFDVPIDIPVMKSIELNRIYRRTKMLLSLRRYNDAIEYVMKEFKIPNGGYVFRYSNTVLSSASVTNHTTKSVEVGTDFMEEPCELFRALRHEAEHVKQMAHANGCGNGSSTFDSHWLRERSAYLNDIRNIPKMCPNEKVAQSTIEYVTSRFFESYTKD